MKTNGDYMTRKGVWSRRVLSIAPGESTSRNTKLHIRVHVCLVLRALDSLRKALRQQWGAFGVVVSNVKVFGKGGFLILCFGFCRPCPRLTRIPNTNPVYPFPRLLSCISALPVGGSQYKLHLTSCLRSMKKRILASTRWLPYRGKQNSSKNVWSVT